VTIATGTRLGPYEIIAKLGEGGMGEVWRAKDSHLGREVALKVLPEAFTADPERTARFEREAKLLASLNHPNIAQIYGLETSADTRALVMELVEGPTLAERLEAGSIPLNESLSLARQIAEALEEAHEKGIIHRDLKPQNIKASVEGKVKVLDFGLAKALDPAGASGIAPASASQLAASPTLTLGATVQGVILGTASYMSPEQAKGLAVDKRADIWAFGVVLFEMLSGKRLFDGDSVPETLAGVLKGELDFSALPADVPAAIRRLLRRCLERNPKNRLHDIADARLVLQDAGSPETSFESQRQPSVAPPLRTAALLGIGVVAGALLGILSWRSLAPSGAASIALPVMAHLSVVPPPGQTLIDFLFSPDGRALAFFLRPRADRQAQLSLFLRPLTSGEASPVDGSEGVRTASFSPDGRWLYFVSPLGAKATQLRLARVPVDGSSAPVTVRRWDEAWSYWTVLEGGDVLATVEQNRNFVRLPADGSEPGAARDFVTDVPGAGIILNDGRSYDGSLLAVMEHYGARGYQLGVTLLDPATGKVRLVVDDANHGFLLPSGRLLFGRGDALLVAPLDAAAGKLTDAPRAVLTGIRTGDLGSPYPMLGLSRDGTLVYPPGGRVGAQRRLVVVDGRGDLTPWSSNRMPLTPVLSVAANGRLAQVAMEPNGLLFEIWFAEREAPDLRRLVSVPGVDCGNPVLSRDGARLAMTRNSYSAEDGLYVLAVDTPEGARRLLASTPSTRFFPLDWSPDGTRLLALRSERGALDVVELAVDGGDASPRALLASSFDESDARYSPDGRALAYVSNESGRNEIYVAPLRADGGVGPSVAVSGGPGARPRWRPDGKSIVFWDGLDQLLSVPITVSPRISAGAPRALVDLEAHQLTEGFEILPDGRLLIVQRDENEGEIQRLDVVLGFTAALERGEKLD